MFNIAKFAQTQWGRSPRNLDKGSWFSKFRWLISKNVSLLVITTLIVHITEAHQEPSETSKRKLFAKTVNKCKPLIIFTKSSTLDVLLFSLQVLRQTTRFLIWVLNNQIGYTRFLDITVFQHSFLLSDDLYTFHAIFIDFSLK